MINFKKNIHVVLISIASISLFNSCMNKVDRLYGKAMEIECGLPNNPNPDADYRQLLDIYKEISEANVPDSLKGYAYYMLSIMDSENGRPTDTPQLDWLQKAADVGNTNASGILGAAYFIGMYGLPRDEHKALDYLLAYDKAATHDIPKANAVLGALYYEGKLIEHDIDKATGYLTAVVLTHNELSEPLPDFSDTPDKNLLARIYIYRANLLIMPTSIESKWVQIGDRAGSENIRTLRRGSWTSYVHNLYNAYYYYRCALQLGGADMNLAPCIQVLGQYLKTYEKYANNGRPMHDVSNNTDYVLRSTHKYWETLENNYWGQTDGIRPSGWGLHYSATKKQCWLAIGQWTHDFTTKGTAFQLIYTQEQGFSMFVGSLKFVHNSWSNSWEGYNSGIYYGHDGQIKKY